MIPNYPFLFFSRSSLLIFQFDEQLAVLVGKARGVGQNLLRVFRIIYPCIRISDQEVAGAGNRGPVVKSDVPQVYAVPVYGEYPERAGIGDYRGIRHVRYPPLCLNTGRVMMAGHYEPHVREPSEKLTHLRVVPDQPERPRGREIKRGRGEKKLVRRNDDQLLFSVRRKFTLEPAETLRRSLTVRLAFNCHIEPDKTHARSRVKGPRRTSPPRSPAIPRPEVVFPCQF